MKNHLFHIMLFASVLASGCATTPSRVHTGDVKARTFSFVKPDAKNQFQQSDNRDYVHAAIQEAIKHNLETKGLTHLAKGGDVTVAYLVIIGDNVSTKAINDHFGYGRDYYDLQAKAHKAGAIDNTNPNYFQVGTLLVDVIDGKTQKLVYRDFAYRELFKNLPETTRRENLQKAVDQLLAKLRVAKPS
jgi:hypothetical protein